MEFLIKLQKQPLAQTAVCNGAVNAERKMTPKFLLKENQWYELGYPKPLVKSFWQTILECFVCIAKREFEISVSKTGILICQSAPGVLVNVSLGSKTKNRSNKLPLSYLPFLWIYLGSKQAFKQKVLNNSLQSKVFSRKVSFLCFFLKIKCTVCV